MTIRLIGLLLKERVNIIVADPKVLTWTLQNETFYNGVSNPYEIKNAGCLTPQPFYLALTQTVSNQQIILQLNGLLIKPENLIRLNQLFTQITLPLL